MRRNVRTEKNKLRMRTKRELQRQTETPEARAVRLLQVLKLIHASQKYSK